MTASRSPASSWPGVRLGDVAKRVSYRHMPDPGVPERWIGAKELDESDLRVRRWSLTDDPMFPPTFKFRFDKGAVLIHSRNPKKVAIADFQAITGEKLFALGPVDPSTLDPRFLALQLQSESFDHFVNRWLAGSVNKFLNWTALERYEFPLPPLEEQQQIVKVLSALEECAETRTEAAAAAKGLLEAVSVQVEMGAKTAMLSKIVKFAKAGGTPRRDNRLFFGGAIPWLKSGEIRSRRIQEAAESITDAAIANSSAWIMPAGTVVIAMYGDGSTAGDVGVLTKPMSCNQAVLGLVPDEDQVMSEYLYLALSRRKAQLRAMRTGSTQGNLSKALITTLTIPLPDLKEQASLVAAAAALLAVVRCAEQSRADILTLTSSARESLTTREEP